MQRQLAAARQPGGIRQHRSRARQRRHAASLPRRLQQATSSALRGDQAALAPLLKSLSAIAVRQNAARRQLHHGSFRDAVSARHPRHGSWPYSRRRSRPPDWRPICSRSRVPATLTRFRHDRLFVALQYLLPHHLLCRVVYAAEPLPDALAQESADSRLHARLSRPRWPMRSSPSRCNTAAFNAFFTRALRAGARPDRPGSRSALSPPAMAREHRRPSHAATLLQAKSHRFTLEALLAGEAAAPRVLRRGLYATLYLAPYNYHRVHMPLAGRLRGLARARPAVLGQRRHRRARATAVCAQ
jgi:hypothetical protein